MALARGAARRRVLAICSATGGARSRLFSHPAIESELLAMLGGAAAFAISPWISAALLALAGNAISRAAEIHLDCAIVIFGAVLTLLTGLALGSVPALRLASTDVAESLKA